MTDAASLARDDDGKRALLFIYGTLMRGLALHHHMAGATFIGAGRVRGTLVSLGRYPGLVDGSHDVRGELYELEDPGHLEALDDVEDYDPEHPEDSEYLRTKRDVLLDSGQRYRAWIYLYNRDATGCPPVSSGDWRRPGATAPQV